MKDFFKDIVGDKITRLGFIITFVLLVVTFIFVLFSYNSLPPFIPIFNQLPWGEQRLGIQSSIFIPILIIVLIFMCNLFLSAFAYKRIPLASRMLAITSLIASILVFFFTTRTIQLVL